MLFVFVLCGGEMKEKLVSDEKRLHPSGFLHGAIANQFESPSLILIQQIIQDVLISAFFSVTRFRSMSTTYDFYFCWCIVE